MKIRSTEKPHSFTDKLRKAIPIYDLQGLTLDSNKNFTAGIEAVEYGPSEQLDPRTLFSVEEWKGKWSLCNHLSVPLYVLTYKTGKKSIDVFDASFDGNENHFRHDNTFTFNEFVSWWASIKRTVQKKPLYEAGSRISFFDDLLAKSGLAWGGNIDGFLLDTGWIPQAILETRYSSKKPLETYDPADYFKYRDGDYKTWEPLILLAMELRTPLFLLTFERKSSMDRLGFSVIDSISTDKLFYRHGLPFDNIVRGVEKIRQQIMRKLSQNPPYMRST